MTHKTRQMGNGAPAALPAQPPSDALEVRQLEAQLRQLQLQLGSERSARERMESAAQEQISRLTLQLQQQQHERAAAAAAVPSPAAPAQSSSSAVEAREVEQWTKRASDLEERLRKAMLSRDRLLQVGAWSSLGSFVLSATYDLYLYLTPRACELLGMLYDSMSRSLASFDTEWWTGV